LRQAADRCASLSSHVATPSMVLNDGQTQACGHGGFRVNDALPSISGPDGAVL
jgi:hypothetical protein